MDQVVAKVMDDGRMDWWREARFGMIVHWGLYSALAGQWKGQQMEYIGEWIMSKFHIPNSEYEKLAAGFSPDGFCADDWVRLAKHAGMGYIVVTSKHHDGFAMYGSHSDPYNIVDATPFGRDPMKELAAACAEHGVKLCFYYSQALDWHESDAGGWDVGPTNAGEMWWGNVWDFPDDGAKDFARYFESKVKPQVTELLTQYGPVGLLWFDCPFTISLAQCQELYALVRELQPDCIMNSRLGNGLGDYGSLGDNLIPAAPLEGDWEAVGTLNDTWGYKTDDVNWKSARDVLELLTGLAGKGVNYALNMGPTEEGIFPEASVNVLKEVGDWMSVHGASIRGTMGTPFAGDLPSGPVTQRGNRLYLHLHRWPGDELLLTGLRSPVKAAYLMSDAQTALPLSQGGGLLAVALPAQIPDVTIPVLVIEVEGDVEASHDLIQQGDGSITLPACRGANDGSPELRVGVQGVVENWRETDMALRWRFTVAWPGRYRVRVTTGVSYHGQPWQGGHRIVVETGAGAPLRALITRDEDVLTAATRCYKQAISNCGQIDIPEAGECTLRLSAEEICGLGGSGLALVAVTLVLVP